MLVCNVKCQEMDLKEPVETGIKTDIMRDVGGIEVYFPYFSCSLHDRCAEEDSKESSRQSASKMSS